MTTDSRDEIERRLAHVEQQQQELAKLVVAAPLFGIGGQGGAGGAGAAGGGGGAHRAVRAASFTAGSS